MPRKRLKETWRFPVGSKNVWLTPPTSPPVEVSITRLLPCVALLHFALRLVRINSRTNRVLLARNFRTWRRFHVFALTLIGASHCLCLSRLADFIFLLFLHYFHMIRKMKKYYKLQSVAPVSRGHGFKPR